jgi:hypothetical protein
MATWTCATCSRSFARKNQRHACGTGERGEVLRGRSQEIVDLYAALERVARSLGPVEFVTRERYVLLRTVRIFADAVIMADAIRLAVHLGREVRHRLFFKIVADRSHVTHVAKLRSIADLDEVAPFLREAREHSRRAS